MKIRPLLLSAAIEGRTSSPLVDTTMTAENTSSIQSVDLSPFFVDEGAVIGDNPTAAQQECAKAIDDTCRKHGFLHVTGFGMTAALNQRVFEASKEFFDLPDKSEACRLWQPSHNMGYSPYKTESTNPNRPPELKEAFNVRFPPAHENDYRGCTEAFVTVAEELQAMFKTAATRYGLACALALGLPTDFFSSKLQDMDLCTIRCLHYPPCDFNETSISTDKPIRVGEHIDFGAYTFLMLGSHGAEGLQIKPVSGGQVGAEEGTGWLDVEIPPSEGGAIINTGALIARWTNDEWRATAHRVIVPSPLEAGRHRYSIAFFVDPDAEAVVSVHDKFVSEEKPCRYEPITSLEFLKMKLTEVANPMKKSGED